MNYVLHVRKRTKVKAYIPQHCLWHCADILQTVGSCLCLFLQGGYVCHRLASPHEGVQDENPGLVIDFATQTPLGYAISKSILCQRLKEVEIHESQSLLCMDFWFAGSLRRKLWSASSSAAACPSSSPLCRSRRFPTMLATLFFFNFAFLAMVCFTALTSFLTLAKAFLLSGTSIASKQPGNRHTCPHIVCDKVTIALSFEDEHWPLIIIVACFLGWQHWMATMTGWWIHGFV